MSILFGRWNFDGETLDPDYLGNVRSLIEPFAPDGVTTCVNGSFAILFGAVHITEQSKREAQPAISQAGNFLNWDGRLDNRDELLASLPSTSSGATDIEIVAKSWEKDGVRSFGNFIGDWSLSIWNKFERALILARDFLGSRLLYYFRSNRYVIWSTLLEPLLRPAKERFTLSGTYIAGWLAGYPAAHLTPYEEIHAVPPASLVRITSRSVRIEKYWDFRPAEKSICKSDGEYEERFRQLFSQSVHRRLRSSHPVLAQLSGGMDSSAIVCTAHKIAKEAGIPSVETVSYFDDSEPNWNERPYFTAVEAHLDRKGFHLDVANDGHLLPQRGGSFPVTPAHGGQPAISETRLAQYIHKGNFRVLLSGSGGDEFTGGALTGIPELADMLRQARFAEFLRRAFRWSIALRKPLIHIVGQTVETLFPLMWASPTRRQWPMPWLTPYFAHRHLKTLRAAVTRFRFFGPLPTFQENLHALEGLRRQIACAEVPPVSFCEKRYPFLDRDLLDFLFNIPREQLVRPNQRRSLLRRALRGIVPDVVLDRPRKAFVATSHLKAVASDWPRIAALTESMELEANRTVNLRQFRETLEQARLGKDVPLLPVMRALRLEWWMQDPAVRDLFQASPHVRMPALLRKGPAG